MSTFSRLSAAAQYDDIFRLVNKEIEECHIHNESYLAIIKEANKRCENLELAHEKAILELRSIFDKKEQELQREIRKRDRLIAESEDARLKEKLELQRTLKKKERLLEESRVALVREARDKKALYDKMRQVKQLVESKDGLEINDANRRRFIKYLDFERLSPIQSYDDSDDCASGIDYDRTEDDIVDTELSARRSNAYDDAVENLQSNEQPTLLCRYYDKSSGNNDDDELQRRATRRGGAAQGISSQAAAVAAAALSNNNDQRSKYSTNLASETDSNGMDTDENDIEYVRQQLQKYEAEKKEKLASANSTPNMKNQNKAATMAAKSAASLMKAASNINKTPSQNTPKPHRFITKKIMRPETCGPCGRKISFFHDSVKCENCGVTSHPECKEMCPLPCVKITAPSSRSNKKMILISDYVNNDAVPKVPALIVHCCNEIEREGNITTEGLYRVVARTTEIEDLQTKILKSRNGMPNLSKFDVHLLTGVVKRFLQSLDESLITTTMWSHFAEAVRLDSDVERQSHMSYFISFDLPAANRDTLAYLMQHLHAIAKNSDKNMMTIKNLAKTLAPTIIGNSCRKPSASAIQQETRIQIQIMETLFNIEEEFWSKYVQKIPTPRAASLGSRLLGTPSSHEAGPKTRTRTGTLPTPKLKPLFS